ncbi:MAG: outer membrane beta-barrel protein [Chitinophagales bacterium]
MLRYLIICLLLSGTLYAQQFRYGFTVAPKSTHLVLPADLYDTPALSFGGFEYGFLFDQTFGKGEHIGLQFGINLNYGTVGMSQSSDKPTPSFKEWEVRTQYLEFPLLARVRTGMIGKMIVYGEGGISPSYCVRARGDYTENGITHDTDLDYLASDKNNIYTLRSNMSIQAGLGTEWAITETAYLVVGFFYRKGLSDVMADNNEKSDILLNQTGIRIAGLF